ncbi:MAG: hypothetical protein HDT33_08890 [Clostridiales bacterium]|nr:hypothetical protein [Clostridiales bacterium]
MPATIGINKMQPSTFCHPSFDTNTESVHGGSFRLLIQEQGQTTASGQGWCFFNIDLFFWKRKRNPPNFFKKFFMSKYYVNYIMSTVGTKQA